jgi:hypothetical protein
MPHTLALSGWPFYFLNQSAVKKVKKVVAGKLDPDKREETDVGGIQKNQFFKDSEVERRHPSGSQCADCCLGVFTMEAGLLSINKLLLSVIGQPRGNLLTQHTPITQVPILYNFLRP